MPVGWMDLRRKLFWVSVLYFAEGFPFGIAIDNLPVYFRLHGVSLTEIGLMSLLGAPWTLKVLWAPLVDRFGTRQQWSVSCLAILALVMAALPLFNPSAPTIWLWALLMLLTTASATQDIAIDAYTIGLLSRGEEGVANGVRASAYRVALIVGGGGLLALGGRFGWVIAYYCAAALCVGLAVLIARSPRLTHLRGEVRQAGLAPLRQWLMRPGAPLIFLFVLTYKLGDVCMGSMVKPFWVDRGLRVEEIAFISATLGVGASIIGSLTGGALTSRWGIFRGLWVLGLLQAFTILGYASVAYFDLGRSGIYAAALCESFAAGLGTAAFLAFLTRICDKRNAATEFALLSAIFAIPRFVAAPFSGWAATHLGYGTYFAVTFLLALPAFGLLPWVKPWAESTPPEQHASTD